MHIIKEQCLLLILRFTLIILLLLYTEGCFKRLKYCDMLQTCLHLEKLHFATMAHVHVCTDLRCNVCHSNEAKSS